MLQVSEEELKNRIRYDNPWWRDENASASRFPKRRHFFAPFYKLVTQKRYNRAVILMGMRRVGKTEMMRQAIDQLLEEGVEGSKIFQASLDKPVFMNVRLDVLIGLFRAECGHDVSAPLYVFFDEIQYLRDWEIHLKTLVDDFPSIRFCASGSAAAALKRRSRESGAGRFSDFNLPSLTFAEFLDFRNIKFPESLSARRFAAEDVTRMNEEFVRYVNFGGFPEISIDAKGEEDFEARIGEDIADRVLLRDLPALYGISDPQELNRLFVTIAYNSGQELSLDGLSQSSHVAKNTIGRYLDYLEAAFLIRRLYRIDQNAKRFLRDRRFKVYLTNTSLRTALFGPLKEPDRQVFGSLVETTIFDHLAVLRGSRELYFERGRDGASEVDFVFLDRASLRPIAALEAKWSDRPLDRPEDLESLRRFLAVNPHLGSDSVIVTTRSRFGEVRLGETPVRLIPSAVFCHMHGRLAEAWFVGVSADRLESVSRDE